HDRTRTAIRASRSRMGPRYRVRGMWAAASDCKLTSLSLVKTIGVYCVATLVVAAAAAAAPAGRSSWAAAEIARVTSVGVLGDSAASFRPQDPLTERALAAAIAATDRLLNPPAPPAPPPAPVVAAPTTVSVLSSVQD